jgi:hypothetical protein
VVGRDDHACRRSEAQLGDVVVGFEQVPPEPYVTGTRDRAARNVSTMTTTLERIKGAAEE